MKLQIEYKKERDASNQPEVKVCVTCLSSEVSSSIFTDDGDVDIYPRTDCPHYTTAARTFPTVVEAKTWADALVEMAKRQYAAYAAAMKQIDLPDEAVIEFNPWASQGQ